MSLTVSTDPSPAIKKALAPTGKLRACINLGNAVLANRAPGASLPHGISVDIAQALADRLGVPLEMVVVTKAAESVQSVSEGRADMGFFAIDPLRAKEISFTAPYVLIEGVYLVRQDSPLKSNDEIDQTGRKIMVAKGSAYDLYLSRSLKKAELVRTGTSQEVVPHALEQGIEVAAGVKQQLELDAELLPGLRLLPGRFMVIEQAVGASAKQSPEVHAFLRAFVEQQKRSGAVQASMLKHEIEGALVAPLEAQK